MEKYISMESVVTSAKLVANPTEKICVGQPTQKKHQEIISLQRKITEDKGAVQEITKMEEVEVTAKKE